MRALRGSIHASLAQGPRHQLDISAAITSTVRSRQGTQCSQREAPVEVAFLTQDEDGFLYHSLQVDIPRTSTPYPHHFVHAIPSCHISDADEASLIGSCWGEGQALALILCDP